ncbi:MAG: hypothetical protein AVDCRST_MAG58-510 [uncultured Rubrobacteraceae bacterium]|uniref:Uncharacterized protein n=1 Tax=uncultured Rubrobacteraceae bacterium TaxID=349277 RepID=A0A6J4QPL0_9ACTN|nr:MAG: hypothetical protein AVDCRST_MAG58-510 [uncultured Rubrobacteraceae bacterium]
MSSSGCAASSNRPSRSIWEQETSTRSANHSRASATPPSGNEGGRRRGTGTPPASYTASGSPEGSKKGTPIRVAFRAADPYNTLRTARTARAEYTPFWSPAPFVKNS